MRITETLICALSFGASDDRLAFLIEKINEVARPPRAATADNVNIRAMYVVNDQINSHGGRFRHEDLEKLSSLILDSPVLVGHDRSQAPLARTFHAETETRDGVIWLKSYFYWPKAADQGSDDLLLKIDSGVFKECSISFTYTTPECSVCGDDFRSCPHQAGQSSPDGSTIHFIYSGICQVLETSLVFKGSVKGTYITDKLSLEPPTIRCFGGGKRNIIANYRGREFLLVGGR